MVDEVTRLKAKLAKAEHLIRELEDHEGGEGWSQYLREELDQYEFETEPEEKSR